MLFRRLALVSTLAAFAAAQDISRDDIPQQCNAICAEIVGIAQRCDDQNDSDAAELACICQAPNANTLVPSCEACVPEYDQDTDTDDSINDNDVFEVLTRCNFTTTTYNTASANSILQSIASSVASASGSVVVTTTGGAVLTTNMPASTEIAQQTGAAPIQSAGAAIGFGAIGFALGML
ncbi:hypothetical protein IQ07DRAFT_411795 [Pyrenochaeta sp. DS3sAY3a]|nr:hypothetical protein IQ07DRAFT_411795 [Pyrenochaeta sp. DS3sAY3a]